MFTVALLWLFVVFGGLAVGAGLYEMRVVVPRWFPRSSASRVRVDRDAMRDLDSGRRFWAFITTGPLTLLTLASLPVAWQSGLPGRDRWLGAAVVTLVERAMTFGYFIPTALRLMRAGELPPDATHVMASRWTRLNYARVFLSLVGWLLALRALSLQG